MTRRLPILLIALAAHACSCGTTPAPVLTSVSPASIPTDQAATLTLRGRHLQPKVVADLDDPAASRVDDGFTVELRAGDVHVPLHVLRVVPPAQLEARLEARAAAPGTYDVELVDPAGKRARLAAAVTVTPSGCSGLADGTPCDDGDACTRADACLAGTCHGADPVTCTAADACHAAGTCDPVAGTCSSPLRDDGSPCDDGDLCTNGDACRSGACAAGTPTVCDAGDACHDPGACNPASGTCSSPVRDDGLPCDADGDECTADGCSAGVCVAGTPRSCTALDACHLPGTCDPLSGACSDPEQVDGTTCGADACDVSRSCQAGACADVPAPGLRAPLACLAATPATAVEGDAVTLDATCTTPDTAFEARFRFGDGGSGWDTARSPARTSVHAYGVAGAYPAAVEVRDACGGTAYAEADVLVVSADNIVQVTTAEDEGDVGATPASSGGTGLSLREAIVYVNGTARPTTITFASSITGDVQIHASLPGLSAGGASIAGRADVTLDFAGASLGGKDSPCVRLAGADQLAFALRITGCAGTAVLVERDRGRVVATTVIGVPGSTGILARQPATVGPRNVVSGAAVGILLSYSGSGGSITGNLVYASGTGIEVSGAADVAITGNVVHDSTRSGIMLMNADAADVLFDTVHGNGGNGLTVDNRTRKVRVQNSLFTGNGGHGAAFWPQTTYRSVDHNGYHGNGGKDVDRGPAITQSVVGLDPLYVDPTAGDLRLAPGSPMADKGIDIGLDANGPAAGTFNGAAPDLGARESP